MIHALHLLWIVPLAGSFGFVLCAILTGCARSDRYMDEAE